MDITWHFDQTEINWNALSELYKIAPLGTKLPGDLKLVFSNSRFKCFVYHENLLVGAGRALADGKDCSYLFVWIENKLRTPEQRDRLPAGFVRYLGVPDQGGAVAYFGEVREGRIPYN